VVSATDPHGFFQNKESRLKKGRNHSQKNHPSQADPGQATVDLKLGIRTAECTVTTSQLGYRNTLKMFQMEFRKPKGDFLENGSFDLD
jgi:hypothetical protein